MWLATRILGPDDYGRLAAIFAASQFAGQVLVQWTGVSLFRYGCEEFVRTGRVASAFWSRLLVLTICLAVATATSSWWLPIVAGLLRIAPNGYPLVLAYLAATAFWMHAQYTLQAAKLPRTQGLLLAVERAQTTLLLGLLAVSGTTSLLWVTLSYIVAPFIVSAVAVWRLWPLLRPVVIWNPTLVRQLVVFSAPLLPSSIIGYFASNYLDAFFITHFLTVGDLGIYSIAYQLTGTIMQLPLLAGSLLGPLFITLGPDRQDRHITRFLRDVLPLLTLTWSTMCTIAAAVGSWLLPAIFGAPFRGAVDLLWPMMAMAALAGPALIGYFPTCNAQGLTYIVAINAVTAAALNIVMNVVLVPRFGLPGCAWATVIAYAASLVVTAHLVERRFMAGSTWVRYAAFPSVIAAAGALWAPMTAMPLILSLFASGLLVWRYRTSIRDGLAALEATGGLDWAMRPRRRYLDGRPGRP